jgi:hypothetical protein
MSLTREEIVERGRREWEEKSENDRDWRGWLHIGEALDVGRREVENRIANRSRSGTTARFKGRAFNERFGLWLSENGFKDLGGKKYAATRSHLMDCLENRAAIETWRKDLQGYQRTAWNHPTTVLRHWKSHLADEQEKARIAAGGEPKPKQPAPIAKANEAIRNLVDENDRLRKAPREGDLFKWSEGHGQIAKVLVADALANGCAPYKIRRIANGMLSELKATTFVPKEKPASRRRQPASPPKPVIPPWCKPGPLQARATMLLQAIEAAGTKGLHIYDDINPLDLSDAASDRGFDAKIELSAAVIEIDKRVDLRQFAPGATVTDDAPEAPQPIADDPQPLDDETKLLQALTMAGTDGLTTTDIDAIVIDAAPLIGRLTTCGAVINTGGRFYLSAAWAAPA